MSGSSSIFRITRYTGPIMSPKKLTEKYQEKAKTFDNRRNENMNPKRAGMIEALDQSVGRIVAKLDDLGLAENTVIRSDRGQWWRL